MLVGPHYLTDITIRPLQDVDVLAVLDFHIPYTRPETLNFYLRYLLNKHESPGWKLGCPKWLLRRNWGTQRSGTERKSTSWGALITISDDFRLKFKLFWSSESERQLNGHNITVIFLTNDPSSRRCNEHINIVVKLMNSKNRHNLGSVQQWF